MGSFLRIDGPGLLATIALTEDVVVEAPPALAYLIGWTRLQVRTHCQAKHWSYLEL